MLTKKANPTYTVDISARQALKQFGWIPKSDIDKAIEWLGFDWNFACPPENASFLLNFPLPRDYMYFVTDQKQGYAKLVHCLADSFLAPHDDRLHLNTAIQEVDWDNNCVCVTVTKYQSNHKYCATSAILTFSVGVLKNNHIKFNPIVPSSKLAAISKIGVGYYLKVFLEFSETFWGKDDVSTILHVSTKKGYYVHFQSLMQNLHGKPPILIATLTGESVCNLSSNDIKYQVVQVLIKIFGPSVPEPTAVTIPDWCNNPLYYGMFSYPSYKFTKLDFHSLQVSAGCLYFAGEAFVKDGEAGFVHSALKSGIETADEILNRFH